MLKLRLPESGKTFLLDKIELKKEKDSAYFVVQSTEQNEINFTIPYPLFLIDEYLREDYSIYAFTSDKYYKEEDIFQVNVDQKSVGRIGWILPVQALVSNSHSKFDNEFFLRYAFVCFKKLLHGDLYLEDVIFESSEIEKEVTIDEIFSSEMLVLCLSNDKTKLIEGFSISDYSHSFYQLQYCLQEKPVHKPVYYSKFNQPKRADSIKINRLSLWIRDDIFIKAIFEKLLLDTNHPLVRFHLLYQIVELLINRVYDREIDLILLLSKKLEKSQHELLGDITELHTELYRVKKLFEKYLLPKPISSADFMYSCNQLLKLIDKTKLNIGDALYQTRNLVVHNFRTVTTNDADLVLFQEVVLNFEKCMIEVLTSYTETETPLDMERQPLAWLMYRLMQEEKKEVGQS